MLDIEASTYMDHFIKEFICERYFEAIFKCELSLSKAHASTNHFFSVFLCLRTFSNRALPGCTTHVYDCFAAIACRQKQI